jgi:hypothetical protein
MITDRFLEVAFMAIISNGSIEPIGQMRAEHIRKIFFFLWSKHPKRMAGSSPWWGY